MAEKMKPNGSGGSAGAGHNSEGMKKIICECAGIALSIQEERKRLNEQMGDIRQRLRDAGVQTRAFDFACKVRQMESEAQGEYLDSLRINFDALQIGGQGEMFLATVGEAQDGDAAKQREEDRAAGKADGLAGKGSDVNPYPSGQHRHGDWHVGWMSAQRQRAREMAPKNAPKADAKPKPKRTRTAKSRLPKARDADTTPLSKATHEGREAAKAGEPADNNPYDPQGEQQQHEYWAGGWKAQQPKPGQRRRKLRGVDSDPTPPPAA